MADKRILDLIYYAHTYLNELESVPHDYGTGEDLFSSDIHTVTAVADHPGINLTQLAEKLSVSKAAVFKFTAKMINRGYLEKKHSINNQKEVLFYATEKGRIAAKGHENFEENTFGPLLQVEKDLPGKDREVISSYLQRLKEIIEK